MLTEHIPLPERNRLVYARKPWRDNDQWSIALYPGNKHIANCRDEAEALAMRDELRIRIAVYKALTSAP